MRKQNLKDNVHGCYDKKKKSDRLYRELNRGRTNAIKAKYRATKLQATPKWLTKEHYAEIQEYYKEAKKLEKLDGIKRHVDHKYPLQGKDVCGLHVPLNLRILTAKENLIKHNNLPQEVLC